MKDKANRQNGNKERPHDSSRNQRPEQSTSNTENNIMQKEDVGNVEEQTISFTLMIKSKGILTKMIKRDDQGQIHKDSTECWMSRGQATQNTLTIEKFAERMGQQKNNQAITHGICEHAKAVIVSKARLNQVQRNRKADSLPVITRTKDNFNYPAGAGLLLLDHDKARDNAVAQDDKALKAYTPKELIAIITEFFPELLPASWVSTFSTSACIYDSKTGKELRGQGAGFHQYLFPKHTRDIPRFLKVLGQRLVLAGYGRIEISRSGSLLERTLVDLLVGSPERLDFIAGAVCDPGLEQRLPKPEYQPGALLDTEKLPDLTEDEEKQYQETIQELKELARPGQDKIKSEYVEQEAEKLVKESNGKLDMDIARGAVKERQNHVLNDDDRLHFAHKKKPVSVAEVLDNGRDYDRKSCADPLEPEYDGGSKSKAIFYFNDDLNPIVHSYAHGNKKIYVQAV